MRTPNKDLKPSMLVVDTSSRVLTLAVSDGRGRIADVNISGSFEHAERFFTLCETTLKGLDLKLDDIEAFGLGLGPGSFTGLRIGFACLKGLLAAKERPVYGVSSLDLIASGISLESGRLAVTTNARRERVYAAFFQFSAGTWQRDGEDQVLSLSELMRQVDGDITIVGDGLEPFGEEIKRLAPKAVCIGRDFWYPRAWHFINEFECRYKQMKALKSEELIPRYLRLSEPEEKRVAKHL